MGINSFNDLISNVIVWAREKNLLQKENAFKQAIKTQEELDEMKIHIYMQQQGIKQYVKNEKIVNVDDAIKDDIGDQLVTLIIQCEQQGTSFYECLDIAWNEIKDRTGRTENGTFIKD